MLLLTSKSGYAHVTSCIRTRHQRAGPFGGELRKPLEMSLRYLRALFMSFGVGNALLQYGSKMWTKFMSLVSCKFKWQLMSMIVNYIDFYYVE